ncbi:MAG: hypothetical protein ACKOUT_13320 [Novosphingobium sp.]
MDAILRLATRPAESTAFSVSLMPEPDEGWLELLAMGLTFDLQGLDPFQPERIDSASHYFGLSQGEYVDGMEALRLSPGPHLAGSATMLPVLRVLAGLGAELARLPGLIAVGWVTSGTRMAPSYFMSSVRAWLAGGAFPALGLTGICALEGGGVTSEGFALFAGYEVSIEPLGGESMADCAKLAARAMHHIVQMGPSQIDQVIDSAGRGLRADMPVTDGVLRLWRSV